MDTVLCCSLDSLCSCLGLPWRLCPVCSDLSIQTGPLREYGFGNAVLFQVSHSNVRVSLHLSWSQTFILKILRRMSKRTHHEGHEGHEEWRPMNCRCSDCCAISESYQARSSALSSSSSFVLFVSFVVKQFFTSVRGQAFLSPVRFTHSRDRKSTRLNSSHIPLSRMPSSA